MLANNERISEWLLLAQTVLIFKVPTRTVLYLISIFRSCVSFNSGGHKFDKNLMSNNIPTVWALCSRNILFVQWALQLPRSWK